MRLGFSAEQELFRESIRAFLRHGDADGEVRRLAGSGGHDPDSWRAMADRLGLQGLIVPEQYGGGGFGQQELAVVLEELGRTLAHGAYFPTAALAVNALLLSDDEAARADYLPGIADGSRVATVALTDRSGSWDASGLTVHARPAGRGGSGWRLSGEQSFVLAGDVADLVLVFARAAETGLSLFAVDRPADGFTSIPLTSMDLTRPESGLRFDDTPARLVGAPGTGRELHGRLLDLAGAALAAEQVGGAQRALEMAVEYAGARTQFGQPIGSFQAIKHKCADMLVEVEAARSCAYYAALAAATGSADLPVAAALAQLRCSQAYLHICEENILVHGAIGYTWEHRAQLFFRRASADLIYLGGPAVHRDRLGARFTNGRFSPACGAG